MNSKRAHSDVESTSSGTLDMASDAGTDSSDAGTDIGDAGVSLVAEDNKYRTRDLLTTLQLRGADMYYGPLMYQAPYRAPHARQDRTVANGLEDQSQAPRSTPKTLRSEMGDRWASLWPNLAAELGEEGNPEVSGSVSESNSDSDADCESSLSQRGGSRASRSKRTPLERELMKLEEDMDVSLTVADAYLILRAEAHARKYRRDRRERRLRGRTIRKPENAAKRGIEDLAEDDAEYDAEDDADDHRALSGNRFDHETEPPCKRQKFRRREHGDCWRGMESLKMRAANGEDIEH